MSEQYTSYPVCVVPPERHYDNYVDLVNDIKKFEERRAYFYTANPDLKGPCGKFEEIQDIVHSSILLMPIAQDYSILYRGQGEYHDPCLPTLYRKPRTEIELFIERVKIMEFKLLLESYELTTNFYKKNYNVDYVGLAQHYGLNTDVLDLTSDMMIAMFFAMCDYDSESDVYRAKTEDREYVGYLYAVLTPSFTLDIDMKYSLSQQIKPIGLQPFKRPGVQKGFSLHQDKENINIFDYLYSFNYTKEDSEYIYNKYQQGTALWYKDEITEYAKEIKRATTFSNQAVSLAVRKWGIGKSITKWSRILRSYGYKLVNRKSLPWYHPIIACSANDWFKIQEQIQYRRVFLDDKILPRITTSYLGSELIRNLLYGCMDAPKGYDSGVTFLKGNNLPEYGLNVDFAHTHVIPDKIDGKIHSDWSKNNVEFLFTRSFELPDCFKSKKVYMHSSRFNK